MLLCSSIFAYTFFTSFTIFTSDSSSHIPHSYSPHYISCNSQLTATSFIFIFPTSCSPSTILINHHHIVKPQPAKSHHCTPSTNSPHYTITTPLMFMWVTVFFSLSKLIIITPHVYCLFHFSSKHIYTFVSNLNIYIYIYTTCLVLLYI